jgi:DNA primase
MSRFSPEKLRFLRNQISIADLICSRLELPNKIRDSYLRFLCPLCSGFDTAVNPKTNLARCFACQKNFNPIDLVIAATGCSFIEAINFLENPALSFRHFAALSRRR